VLPAIDVGKSVSRVGGKAQLAAYRTVAANLKLDYAQFEELESFARFGARLDDSTRASIAHGRRIRACLKQPEFSPVSVTEQITELLALADGLFDTLPLERMVEAELALRDAAATIPSAIVQGFVMAKKLEEDDKAVILQIARRALTIFASQPDTKVDA
jgi:F-type H+-transporting ATPase subunit alpha